MKNYNGLQPPIAELTRLSKEPTETNHSFLRRLRLVFRRLSPFDANLPMTIDTIKFLLQTFTKDIWERVDDKGLTEDAKEMLESAIEIASATYNPSPAQTDTLKVDLGLDDVLAAETQALGQDELFAVANNNCFNCGKKGHWARNCRQPRHNSKPQEYSRQRRYDDKPQEYSRNAYKTSGGRNRFVSSRGRGRGQRYDRGKIYATEQDQLEDDHPDNLDQPSDYDLKDPNILLSHQLQQEFNKGQEDEEE